MSEFRTPRRAVSAVFLLAGAMFGIWASRIPSVAIKHQLGEGQLGLLLLLLAAGAIAAFPLAGRWADRFGAAPVTLRFGLANVTALFLVALSPNTWTLAIALFAFGATTGSIDVTMNTWAGEVERHVGRPIMASFHALFSLGAGLGAGSGYVAIKAGMDIPAHFLTAGLLFGTTTLGMAWINWTSATHDDADPAPLVAFPKGPLIAVGVLTLCSALGEGAMADWGAIFLVFTTGATEAYAALGYAVFSATMVAMRLIGDRVIHAIGAVRTAQLAGAIAAIGAACAVLFANYTTALVGFALMGVGYAVIFPLSFSRAANDPQIKPGAAIASVATLGYGGALIGPPLIGFVAELTSIRTAFALLIALAGLITVLAGSLRVTPKS